MDFLPYEIYNLIFQNITEVTDLCHLKQVSKKFVQLLNHKIFWKNFETIRINDEFFVNNPRRINELAVNVGSYKHFVFEVRNGCSPSHYKLLYECLKDLHPSSCQLKSFVININKALAHKNSTYYFIREILTKSKKSLESIEYTIERARSKASVRKPINAIFDMLLRSRFDNLHSLSIDMCGEEMPRYSGLAICHSSIKKLTLSDVDVNIGWINVACRNISHLSIDSMPSMETFQTHNSLPKLNNITKIEWLVSYLSDYSFCEHLLEKFPNIQEATLIMASLWEAVVEPNKVFDRNCSVMQYAYKRKLKCEQIIDLTSGFTDDEIYSLDGMVSSNCIEQKHNEGINKEWVYKFDDYNVVVLLVPKDIV